MTLYVFDRTLPAAEKVSATALRHQLAAADGQGQCGTHGDWSVVTRDDGSKQWAYKGRPLYFGPRTPSPVTRRATAS
jgi:predicted lipoprotein with Yx(FWY)xxD motif